MRESYGILVPDEDDLMHLKEAIDNFFRNKGRDPSQQELADLLGIPPQMALEWLMWDVAARAREQQLGISPDLTIDQMN